MPEGSDPIRDACDAVFDAFRQIGDVSYAIFPRNIAHSLADLEKAVLSELRGCVDWQIRWIDERVAGGDRLREKWHEKYCPQTPAEAPTTPAA